MVVSDWAAPIAAEHNNQLYYSEIKISKFSLPQISDLQATTGLLSGTQWRRGHFALFQLLQHRQENNAKVQNLLKTKNNEKISRCLIITKFMLFSITSASI